MCLMVWPWQLKLTKVRVLARYTRYMCIESRNVISRLIQFLTRITMMYVLCCMTASVVHYSTSNTRVTTKAVLAPFSSILRLKLIVVLVHFFTWAAAKNRLVLWLKKSSPYGEITCKTSNRAQLLYSWE